jgi:hypothetical protein
VVLVMLREHQKILEVPMAPQTGCAIQHAIWWGLHGLWEIEVVVFV